MTVFNPVLMERRCCWENRLKDRYDKNVNAYGETNFSLNSSKVLLFKANL